MDLESLAREVSRDTLSRAQLERLARLDSFLESAGPAVGATGWRRREERAARYFGEALAALDFVPETGRCVDVGSGGGTPALPLAIARPALEWTLVESNTRKCVFLEEAARACDLQKVRVVRTRYEAARAVNVDVDVITARGVRVEALLTSFAEDLVAGGRAVIWTSEVRGREIAASAGESWANRLGPRRLDVQGTDAAYLVVLEK